MDFKNQVVIVTGGANGIGASVCESFARKGAKVIISDISESGSTFQNEIQEKGYHAHFIKTDVKKENDIKSMFDSVMKKYGKIDIVIANAGIADTFSLEELSLKQWNNVIDINLTGVFLTNKYAIEKMMQQGNGAIVNTASMLGTVGKDGVISYTSSKGGVVNLTRTLGVTYAREGIRINSVCPGYIKTNITANKSSNEIDALEKLHPIQRLGSPHEVAKAIMFLASQEASFICGSNLIVDGGYTAQ